MKGLFLLSFFLVHPALGSTPDGPKKEDILKNFQVTSKPPSSPPPPIPSSPPRVDDYPAEYLEYDKKSAPLWKLLTPKVFVGEEMELEIAYFGLEIGSVTLKTLSNQFVGGRECHHLRLDLQTSDFYRKIYRIKDYGETFWDVKAFLPWRYYLSQDESKQKVTNLQVFDHLAARAHSWYKRKKRKKNKDESKTIFSPRYFQDSLSALSFLRGLPLVVGKVYQFPVVSRGKIWSVVARVSGREKIELFGKKHSAIRVKAVISLVKGGKKKKGDKSEVTLWFSDDKTKKILGLDAKMKLGKIKGRLRRYRAGD